jgi:Mn2+/Fe2+ NRAMP family transporter
MGLKKIFSILGPGLLYAGSAIGVSHLVQSTRAGADYFFDLVWILILVNIIKYPFFEFSTRYVKATGLNLIEGYGKLGRWAVVLFAILTVTTMFAIQAAVTVVTAGIAIQVFHLNISNAQMSALILGIIMILLISGRYRALDVMIKLVIVILAVSTAVAVFSVLNLPAKELTGQARFNWHLPADIFFLIAFIGWMPAPIDVAVWQSLWTQAKQKSSKSKISWRESKIDMNIGYIGTVIMALCFLTLGAKVMYGSGESLSANGVAFAGQLLGMYTTSIGQWAYLFIAIAALTTMLSTTLTCIDAFPRVLLPLTVMLAPIKQSWKDHTTGIYWFWLVVVATGAVILIAFFSQSMRFMVDLATTLSFITAPLLAYMNFRVVTHSHVPLDYRPGRAMRLYAWTGIVFLSAFALFYMLWNLYMNFFI